ncbi:hypothetical protein BH18ACT11_BH18ACT11_13070 [soil metagenome]
MTDGPNAVLRRHAEQEYAEELEELAKADDRQRPPNWQLSPRRPPSPCNATSKGCKSACVSSRPPRSVTSTSTCVRRTAAPAASCCTACV